MAFLGVSGACKHAAARSALLKDAQRTLQARRKVLRPATFKVWREQTLRTLLWRRAYRAELCHAMACTQSLAVQEQLVRVIAVRSAVGSIFAQVGCPERQLRQCMWYFSCVYVSVCRVYLGVFTTCTGMGDMLGCACTSVCGDIAVAGTLTWTGWPESTCCCA